MEIGINSFGDKTSLNGKGKTKEGLNDIIMRWLVWESYERREAEPRTSFAEDK